MLINFSNAFLINDFLNNNSKSNSVDQKPLSNNLQVANFTLGFEIGTEIIWKVTLINNTGLEEQMGVSWQTYRPFDASFPYGDYDLIGAKSKLVVTNIYADSSDWIIEYNMSVWTTSNDFDFTGPAYDYIMINPLSYAHSIDTFTRALHFLPNPVDVYLQQSDFNTNWLFTNFSVESNTFSYYFDGVIASVWVRYTFDENDGILNKFQLINKYNQVIYEYARFKESKSTIQFGYFYIIFIVLSFTIYLVVIKKKF